MTNFEELRVAVRGLVVGMFVSRLDRAWIGTPFPLEGLLLTSEEEVATIQRICTFVYIDTTRGKSPDLRFVEFGAAPASESFSAQDEIAALRTTTWVVKSDFNQELKVAGVAHGVLESGIKEVMTDLTEGRHLDLHKLNDGVDAMVDSILRNPSAFAWLKEMKQLDHYSYHHTLGCAIWAASFGRHLGLEREELQKLSLAGLLIDVGKVRLPVDLLLKTGPLDENEIALTRRHVEYSLEIMQNAEGVTPQIIEIIATHHERHNGSGYPRGLSGNQIPIYGRIMGLVDSYDAMTAKRPYATSRSPHKAVAELYENRGSLFQAELVEQFIQTSGIYPIGTLVELTDGQVGVITAVHSLKRLRPSVMLLLNKDKQPLSNFLTLDLGLVELDAQGLPLGVKGGLPSGAHGIDIKALFLD